MSMGIPLDGAGGEGLGRIGGGASRGGRNIERGAERGRAEREEVKIVVQSMNWKASLASLVWSILQAAAYQASGSMSAGCLKGMVAIWLWMFNQRPRRNFTTRVRGSVYLASETKVRKLSK